MNTDLKSETNSHLHIIKTLSQGNKIDAPWQATSSNRFKKNDKNIHHTQKDAGTYFKSITVHNPYESLYVDDTQEFEILVDNTAEVQRRKPRSNRANRMSSKNVKSYDYNSNDVDDHNNSINNNNTRPKIVPGNRSYASTTKYGKKAVVIGDSHLRRVNKKLFNDALHYCKGNIKYFSGAKSAELEHYIKPTLMNTKPDAVVIHIGTNDIDFRNVNNELLVKNTADNIIKIANLFKEYGVNEIIISFILPKKNIKLSKH